MSEENVVATPSAAEVSESIQSGYDRIANPQQPAAEDPVPTAETPPEPAFTSDQVKNLMKQVDRIPELEKRLRDEGGRYGALKQTIEQLQQRIAEPAAPGVSQSEDIEEILKEVKDAFGDDDLYSSLKSAFSKVVAGNRSADPSAIAKIVAERVEQMKSAEDEAAVAELTEIRPTWMEDRETPEFHEWMESMTERDRSRFARSKDPYFVASKLDEFDGWKAQKEEDKAKPVPKPAESPAKPSTRLANAVLPTNGAKSVATGEASTKQSIRAGYDRVASARR